MSYWRYQIRRTRLGLRRLVQALSLSQRFLMVAAVVVAAAMIILGTWSSQTLLAGITQGIARTAADSIGPPIAHQLEGVASGEPLTDSDREVLQDVFEVGNDADSTRLLQIRIFRSDGSLLFATPGEMAHPVDPADFDGALKGLLAARLTETAIGPLFPLTSHPISLLEIVTPLRRPGTDEVFAVAQLAYSAKALLQIAHEAQQATWLIVGLIGIVVTGALYLLVDRSSRTIASQRERLARNLALSRSLARENRSLHATSEQLRINAILANEYLLTRLGSDIHDGPVQLLALLILRLTGDGPRRRGKIAQGLAGATELATKAIEELRTISAGLVLPELADQELEGAILLAISRHEALTGTTVERKLHLAGAPASTEVKVCAYRLVQEALSNAFHHGDRTRQSVTAELHQGMLMVNIANAVSPRPEAQPATASARQGIGLRAMRFRVEALGGSFEAEFEGSAAFITAHIPLGIRAAADPPKAQGGPDPTPAS